MGKLWVIVRREYLERVRTRWFLFATLFGPALFGGLMFLPALLSQRGRGTADVQRMVVIDVSGTGLGKRVAAELNGGLFGDTTLTRLREPAPAELAAAESAAVRLVSRREVKGYLVLDDRSVAGSKARYVGENAASLSDVNEITRVVRQQVLALRLERAGLDAERSGAIAKSRLELDAQRIGGGGKAVSGRVSVIFAASIAVLLYLSIFVYGQNVLRGVMEEKQTRVAEVVISSVSSGKLLAGKVLGVGAVGLTQTVLWLAVAYAMFEIRAPLLARFGVEAPALQLPGITVGMAAVLVLYFILGYAFYAALFAAVGAMVSSETEAQQAQMPIALLLITSITLLQPVLIRPEGSLARTMSWLPFSAPIVMPLRLSVVPVPPLEIAVSMLSVAAGCVVATWAAARIYRVGLLMYGKRPSLGELARWVRYSR